MRSTSRVEGTGGEVEVEEEEPMRSDDTAADQQQQQPEQEEEPQAESQRRKRASQQQQPATTRNVGYLGKHRLSAAIARLDQEVQSLQEELNELETMGPSSAACQEVITSTEGKPDPLLPVTSGPENSSWDRWFQRVRSSRSNKWWAHRGSDFS